MKNVSAAWLAQFEENKMHSQKTTHIVNEAFAMFGDVMEKIVSETNYYYSYKVLETAIVNY